MLNQLSNQPDLSLFRLAIIGIGNELRGDDGAGVVIARRLKDTLANEKFHPLILEACSAPENILGPVVRYLPQVILMIDAAETGSPPGAISWLSSQEADGVGGSTHTISLAMLSAYLTAETGAAVFILAIQPKNMSFSTPLSHEVETAIQSFVETFSTYWRRELAAFSAKTPDGVSVVSA